MSHNQCVLLCPGQGAQKVGMGRAWVDAHPASAQTFASADAVLDLEIEGTRHKLSEVCFDGPEELLNRTDVSQPALYTSAVASYQGLLEQGWERQAIASAGLSLGEWTALHLAGVIGFVDGLRLVALRGRLMQDAAKASRGSMVALIGADESQADEVCEQAADGEVLVPANYNAPGQIVISGAVDACSRAIEVATSIGLRATQLSVAGAFHSPLMGPAAEGLAEALEPVLRQSFKPAFLAVRRAAHEVGRDADAPRRRIHGDDMSRILHEARCRISHPCPPCPVSRRSGGYGEPGVEPGAAYA